MKHIKPLLPIILMAVGALVMTLGYSPYSNYNSFFAGVADHLHDPFVITGLIIMLVAIGWMLKSIFYKPRRKR